jgi:hypothetical protein
MCERQLTVQFVCDRLEERDAVIAALRPLVAEGWRVDAFYSFRQSTSAIPHDFGRA